MSETQPEAYESAHRETFDVVLVKKGVSPLDAKPEDFRRVTVVASEPFRARSHEDVEKVLSEDGGWEVVDVVPQNGLQEHEQAARARAHRASMNDDFDPNQP